MVKVVKLWGWCYECKAEKKIKEIYFDRAKIAVTLECGHEYYAGTGSHKE